MPPNAIDKIIQMTKAQEKLWLKSYGWAPNSSAELLAKARLDRQVSFANALKDFIEPFPAESKDARQILGYATLRSLSEGVLKLFFTVWYEDYAEDPKAECRKNKLVSPEDIPLDKLIYLYTEKTNNLFETFLRRIQKRGNAIHYFADREVGTQSDLLSDIIMFKEFLIDVDGLLPKPEDVYGGHL